MATLDQLPAEQRAIVELVVQRGRSYAALADVLQVPADRVRELARDALTELSPRTAARVDPEYRGQIADYLLGQQPAGDTQATRQHLQTSETARAWALSLLDSLDPLYPNGAQPTIPEPGDEEPEAAVAVATAPEVVAEPEPAAEPEPKAEAEAEAEADAEPEPKAEAEAEPETTTTATVEERVRERERERKPERERERKREREEKAAEEPSRKPLSRGGLSLAAQSALRRRRRVGRVGGLVVLAGIVVGVLAIAGVFSSDEKSTTSANTGTTTTPAQQPLQVLGQFALKPTGKTKAQGIAYIVQQAGKRFLVVQAQVPPLPQNQKVAAYEVWLYNSNSDARSLGAQYTNAQGVLQGRADLPTDFAKFKFVDVSRELFADKNAGHGNSSVLRGAFSTLKPVPQQQQQGGQGGATTTPQPTP